MAGTKLRTSSVAKRLSSWCNLGKYPPSRLNVSSFKNKEMIENSEILLMKAFGGKTVKKLITQSLFGEKKSTGHTANQDRVYDHSFLEDKLSKSPSKVKPSWQ